MPTATRVRSGTRKSAVRAAGSAVASRRSTKASSATKSSRAEGPVLPSGPVRSSARDKKSRAVVPDFAFTTILAERGPSGLWPHLFLNHEASRWLGKRGMVSLIVNVNGVMFRRTARPDGAGGHYILFNAEMRERTGVEPGDRIRVGLEVDHAPNTVPTPRELDQALLSDPAARGAYGALSPSHRRAYVQFIEEAKRPETKVRRIQQALRMMAQWAEERAAGKKR